MKDWDRVEPFVSRVCALAKELPLRGSWEPNDRIAYALASFRLATEYHESISLLFALGRSSSAHALARPSIEASYRSIWWLRLATDSEIKKYGKGRDGGLPLLGDLIKSLKVDHNTGWQGVFDSLTHGLSRATYAHFLQEPVSNEAKSFTSVMTGLALLGATHDLARVLGRDQLMSRIEAATPDMEWMDVE